MSVEDRVESLKARHAELERELSSETTRPHPDDVHIAILKKEKLKIKDVLARMTG